jgi:ABC-type ATPase involved in cell division
LRKSLTLRNAIYGSRKTCVIRCESHHLQRRICLPGRKVGSGKTSLIKTLNAQLPLKEGSGIVAGYDLSRIKRGRFHFSGGRSELYFRILVLIDRSVNENLEFVLRATGGRTEILLKKG